MKKRVRVYRPLARGALVGNLVLVVVAICVAFVLGLTQVRLSVVLLNLVVAMVAAGVLAYIGSGWAMAAMALMFFLGPVVTRFVVDGAQLSIRVWFMGILAGWALGALVRRIRDRGLPARGSEERPILQWWVRGKRFEEPNPTLAQVEAKIRALDGRYRTLVILRDRARELDLCGDAASGIIVFRTEDAKDDSLWEVPLGAEVDDHDSVETAMGDVSAPVARGLLVGVDEASSIARGFHGGRIVAGSAGTWRGTDVLTVRPSLP